PFQPLASIAERKNPPAPPETERRGPRRPSYEGTAGYFSLPGSDAGGPVRAPTRRGGAQSRRGMPSASAVRRLDVQQRGRGGAGSVVGQGVHHLALQLPRRGTKRWELRGRRRRSGGRGGGRQFSARAARPAGRADGARRLFIWRRVGMGRGPAGRRAPGAGADCRPATDDGYRFGSRG